MKRVFVLSLAAVFFIGCSRQQLKPLAVEEIPTALSNAFKPAHLLVRQNAEGIAKLVIEKQYPPASIQLQTLLSQELSKEQRDTASASLVTLNQILQEQAATLQTSAPEGSPQNTAPKQSAKKEEAEAAAAVMQNYIRTK